MVTERAIPERSVNLFMIISFFVLFTVLLATGGLYFYRGIMTKSVGDKESQLNLAKGGFEPAKVSQLQLLDKRLNAASEILSKHVAITPIFKALSDITMKTVRYTNFSYSLGDDKDAKVVIQMKGLATGYASVALQSDLFGTKDEGKNFIDPVFSNLTLDDKGNVLFDLQFSVDPSFVDYKQMLLTQS